MAEVFYCTYEANGVITRAGRGDDEYLNLIVESGSTLLITPDEVSFGESYVDVATQTVVPMTPVTATTTLSADTDEVVSLTGLPDCTVKYYLGHYTVPIILTPEAGLQEAIAEDTVSDGQLDISSDLAGEYTIILSAPTFLDTNVLLTVEDA